MTAHREPLQQMLYRTREHDVDGGLLDFGLVLVERRTQSEREQEMREFLSERFRNIGLCSPVHVRVYPLRDRSFPGIVGTDMSQDIYTLEVSFE